MRLFFAVHLVKDVEERVGQLLLQLREQTPTVNWVRQQNLHFTLRFLGDVEKQRLEDVLEIGRLVGSQHAACSIRLSGVGTFPKVGSAKVVWLGVDEPHILQQLNRSLERELRQSGFAPEPKPYSPHLTLARIKQPLSKSVLDNLLGSILFSERDPMPVANFSLMESELTPRGPIYRVVESFNLS